MVDKIKEYLRNISKDSSKKSKANSDALITEYCYTVLISLDLKLINLKS